MMKNKKIYGALFIALLLVVGGFVYANLNTSRGKDAMIRQYYKRGENAELVYKNGGSFLSIEAVKRDDNGNIIGVTLEITTLQATPAYRSAETGLVSVQLTNNKGSFEFVDGWENKGVGEIEIFDEHIHIETRLTDRDVDCVWSLEEINENVY